MIKKFKSQLFNLTTHLKCVVGENSDSFMPECMLKDSGLTVMDSMRFVLELVEALGGQSTLTEMRQLVQLGVKALREKENTVSFAVAVDMTLKAKKHCSSRTIQDIRQTMQTLMRTEPRLGDRLIRGISSIEWARILDRAYAHSPSRYAKARANLSGVYTVAFKNGFCDENPIKRIDAPRIRERTIEPLSIADIESLFITARHEAHRDCLPALALMLYAGVRPEEVQRIKWNDIDWEEAVLYLQARHTKTGGGRHIPLVRPLLRMLKRERGVGFICPKQWKQRWQCLRQMAGFIDWVPDILRHSYASYHAKMYHDLPLLQLSMGHRNSQLLLTRYINMRGITKKDAQIFWRAKWLRG